MLNLIKKEIALCLHPTAYIFLCLSCLVFVPNYPYEVIFFFSCLSVYFSCMMSRENGDISFTCALPVKKENIPLARILTAVGLQCVLLLLTGIMGAIKGALVPAEMYINQAGISSNIVLLGNGAILFGVFNIIFYPLYYRKPDKIGMPFVSGVTAVFMLIALFVVLRWATPLFSQTLNGLNSQNSAAKIIAFAVGLAVYAVLTVASCRLSMKNFKKVDV